MWNRRIILKAGLAVGAGWFQPLRIGSKSKSTKIGLIADLHHGLEPTAAKRLDKFMEAVDEKKPDFILQLGDFNFGTKPSRECMEIWNQFKGAKHHVLGNHDMDANGKSHMLDFWEMPGRYYSFDQQGVHFIILDRNHLFRDGKFVPYEKANFYVDGKFRGFADDKQLEWLKQELAQTEKPCVVFCHQGLGMEKQTNPPPAANQPIEKVLADANRGRKTPKVVACFCGHHHIDRYRLKDGIHYVWVNSASYYWVGAKYGRMAPYQDPLFCFLEISNDGTIKIEGKSSKWSEPSPRKRGYPDWEKLNTEIKNRQLQPGMNKIGE